MDLDDKPNEESNALRTPEFERVAVGKERHESDMAPRFGIHNIRSRRRLLKIILKDELGRAVSRLIADTSRVKISFRLASRIVSPAGFPQHCFDMVLKLSFACWD